MADDDAWSLSPTIARERLKEAPMNSMHAARTATAIAVFAMLGGCASWHSLDKPEGTAAGAVGGAVAGAVVAGPVGAVVGGIGGAYVGNETTGKTGTVTTNTRSMTPQSYDASTIRAVQQALNVRGYNAGPADGQYGASTKDAVMRFQQVAGLPVTGELGRPTLDALGVS
jgi:murein L,D-transpeptidase YcbB/YkuD